jgi:hypothetical protein
MIMSKIRIISKWIYDVQYELDDLAPLIIQIQMKIYKIIEGGE